MHLARPGKFRGGNAASILMAEEVTADHEDDSLPTPLAFTCKRHVEKIEGFKTMAHSWRMKERMKTVSVALVLCLNVGVDPPDVVKTQPCARLECWIDPVTMSPQKALEAIGAALQRQYERWQPRARYKQSLDPTVDDVKKLCTSLRRNAKEERVLFHYTGHGVPKPTTNGEIWVFNKTYTQYIPLSVFDLQSWMGSPSIYVYDCSNAGVILDSFDQFSEQREMELAALKMGKRLEGMANGMPPPISVKDCIQLAACGKDELLPMNPELPADLFTACLTTPIKVALRWFVLQNTHTLVPNINLELIDKIPGQLTDRRTMLGELNWIFTAITDTIAWNILPRDLFQRLFRQDLLVASLFRNFLLAERVMRSYNCTPISSPKLPATHQQNMWKAWDLALDLALSQLPDIIEEKAQFEHSTFFAEQLTAFQVWLEHGSDHRSPPEQLPIVLQVLLSQVHRLRALELLGRFLDLGPWAVSLALSVGIFPYVLKLLQASAKDLRPKLVFIWAKILAVDRSCQVDLVKENGYKYFLQMLSDPEVKSEYRTMAAFILAMIVHDYRAGQDAALKGNLIANCLEQLADPNPLLRQWLALCLAKAWHNFDNARWCGVRDSAHDKLDQLLSDPVPEVRASAVYALGTYINTNTTERSDHSNNIDHGVARLLLRLQNDASTLVRAELVVALARFVQQFETQFSALAYQLQEEKNEWSSRSGLSPLPESSHERTPTPNRLTSRRMSEQVGSSTSGSTSTLASRQALELGGMRRSASTRSLKGMLSPTQPSSTWFTQLLSKSQRGSSATLGVTSGGSIENIPMGERPAGLARVASTSSLSSMVLGTYSNVYASVWKLLVQLQSDPVPKIAEMALKVIAYVRNKVSGPLPKSMMTRKGTQPHSAPSSPSNRQGGSLENQLGESPKDKAHMSVYSTPRRPRVPPVAEEPGTGVEDAETGEGMPRREALLTTELFEWSCAQFAAASACRWETDPQSAPNLEADYRRSRAHNMRRAAAMEQRKAAKVRTMEQIFIKSNQAVPNSIKFHPYEPYLVTGDKEGGLSVWDWEQGVRLNHFSNKNHRSTKITSMEFINADDKALLLTGADDGGVRVWRNYLGGFSGSPELVSAWHALSDVLPMNSRSAGLVVEWEQSKQLLYTSGEARIIRIWDMNRETKLQDLPTGADTAVMSLACDTFGRGFLVAGCADGSVRLFDTRLPPNECRFMTYREHSDRVVRVAVPYCGSGRIVSGAFPGDVRFWDCTSTESVKTVKALSGHITAMDIHSQVPIIACGTSSQLIDLFTHSGEHLNTIKYHDGFMGQRIAIISALAFHPNRFKLAAGSVDAFMSVYSNPAQKQR